MVDPPPPPNPIRRNFPCPPSVVRRSAVILTAAKAPEQKSYRAGDTVGDFKLVAFNNDLITFWIGMENSWSANC